MGPCTSLEELYKFNIARKAWSSVPIHGETPVSRTDYSGVLYRDDFYVYGERGESGHNRNDLKFNFVEGTRIFGHKNLCMRAQCSRAMFMGDVRTSLHQFESLKHLCENKVCQSLTIESVARVLEISDRYHATKLKS
ncbi:hypothetical protein L917_18297 [Phytophthora nicotianae]|uniref:Uncharacterized protein n=1 Tax=Phytophthora nicotianae TaxID=4792 RepID=W2K864_PHYNI|nr:hypothetical protein L917_18297 [Phytophthora nicotianae]